MNIVRELRREASLTQQQFAKQTGTSQSTVAAYESGSKSPTLRTVSRLADRLRRAITYRVSPRLTREDARSLAYHEAIADHLITDPPAMIAHARQNLDRWAAMQPGARELFDRWRRWLELPAHDLVILMLDPSMPCRDMRQVSPFAGILTPAERSNILRQFNQDHAA